jgi:hypothetical protein
MTTPHPNAKPPRSANGGRVDSTGKAETWGPLVRQPANAARLARILNHSATDLWDLCTMTDAGQMGEESSRRRQPHPRRLPRRLTAPPATRW